MVSSMSLTRIRVCNSFFTCITGRTSRSVQPDSGEWPSCCQGAPTRAAESQSRVLDLLANPRSPMDLARVHRRSECEWEIAPTGKMRVPAVIYATEPLIRDMDDKVFEQVTNVAALPGIVQASYAMPDAHWGYGFPIGGVAAFDPDRGGVLSAGGVGFDISCGVRRLCRGLTVDDVPPVNERLADALFRHIPAGVGSTGRLHLNRKEMDE